MRVIAGEKGGRRLVAPPGRNTRPTTDRAREAMFSMLESQGATAAAVVWDLFAGSGAMGIEALSRGAEHVTFVDNSRAAVLAIKANLSELGYGPDRATVVCTDALAWAGSQRLSPPGPDVGLVLADPPYAWAQWPALLDALAAYRPWVLIETGSPPIVPPGWEVVRSKRYGATVVTLTKPQTDAGSEP